MKDKIKIMRLLVSIFLFTILLFLYIFYLTKETYRAPTAYFVLIASFSGAILGVGSIFFFVYMVGKRKGIKEKKKKKEFNPHYIDMSLEKKLYNTNKYMIEKVFVFALGDIASYFKRRTSEPSALGKSGVYEIYETILEGAKRRIKAIFKENPKIKEKNYMLSLILETPLTYADKLLELLAYATEAYKRIGIEYIDTKGLKKLASIIKKYVH